MPATAEKYDIDYSEAVIVDSRATNRGAAARASSPARWNQMQSLVEHFGDAAVADPIARPRRKPRIIIPEPTPAQTPRPASQTAPRRIARHQPFRLTLASVIMWGTICGLLLLLLGIHGATLALSQQDMSVASKIQLSQESIGNSTKSLASVQVSPQTAQWAMAHGWHVASQGDFDEVPAAANSGMAEGAQ
ncbi:MAG: hypothetical protein ABI210_05610 [Abditibacteriaceae bacterium]